MKLDLNDYHFFKKVNKRTNPFLKSLSSLEYFGSHHLKSHPIVYLTEGLASGRFKSDQIENDVKVKCVFGQNHWESFFSQIRKKLLRAVAGSGEDVNLMNNLR